MKRLILAALVEDIGEVLSLIEFGGYLAMVELMNPNNSM